MAGAALEEALSFWKGVGLAAKQEKLANDSKTIAATVESAAASRKNLAAKTKIFSTMGNEERMKNFAGIFKWYQKEINMLTKRAQFAEASFEDALTFVSTLRDPTPGMSQAAAAVTSCDAELQKAKAAVDKVKEEMQAQFAKREEELKGQLRDALADEQKKIVAQCQIEIEKRQAAMEAEMGKIKKIVEDREAGHEKRHAEASAALAQQKESALKEMEGLKKSLEEATSKADAAAAEKASATSKLAEAEAALNQETARSGDLRLEVDSLQAQVQSAKLAAEQALASASETSQRAADSSDWQEEKAALEKEVAELKLAAEAGHGDGELDKETAAKIMKLESEVSTLKAQLEVARKKANSVPSAGGDAAALAQELEDAKAELEENLQDLEAMEGNLQEQQDKISELEGRIWDLEGEVEGLKEELEESKENEQALRAKLNDLATA